jgi:hypothetical protein
MAERKVRTTKVAAGSGAAGSAGKESKRRSPKYHFTRRQDKWIQRRYPECRRKKGAVTGLWKQFMATFRVKVELVVFVTHCNYLYNHPKKHTDTRASGGGAPTRKRPIKVLPKRKKEAPVHPSSPPAPPAKVHVTATIKNIRSLREDEEGKSERVIEEITITGDLDMSSFVASLLSLLR